MMMIEVEECLIEEKIIRLILDRIELRKGYLECKIKIDQLFAYHNYTKDKMKVTIMELTKCALIWWTIYKR